MGCEKAHSPPHVADCEVIASDAGWIRRRELPLPPLPL